LDVKETRGKNKGVQEKKQERKVHAGTQKARTYGFRWRGDHWSRIQRKGGLQKLIGGKKKKKKRSGGGPNCQGATWSAQGHQEFGGGVNGPRKQQKNGGRFKYAGVAKTPQASRATDNRIGKKRGP